VALDYQHVDSKVDNLDVGIWASTFQNLDLKLNGSDMPVFTFIPPASGASIPQCSPPSGSCSTYFRGAHNSFQDPYNSFWRSAMDHIEQSEGKEDAAKIDVDYRFAENSWLDSARVGVRWAERDQTTRFSTYNWGVLSEIWGGGGPVWFDDPVNGNARPRPAARPARPDRALSVHRLHARPGSGPDRFGCAPVLQRQHRRGLRRLSAAGLAVGDEWRARNGANGCPQNWVPLAHALRRRGRHAVPEGEINPINEEDQVGLRHAAVQA
jgi:hypothetical protein